MRRSPKLILFVISAAVAAMISADVMAQPGGGRGRGGRGGRDGGGFFGRGGSQLELLMREDIRSEIDLVDDQQEDLRKLGDEFRNSMRSVFEEARESGDWGSIRERMTEMREEIEEQANEILLPHQVERLEQLTMQSRMRRSGTQGVLASDTVKEKLGLTDEQLEEIEEVAKEAQEELQEKIAELQKEARKKILGVLTPEQQKTWESMMGEDFKFDDRNAFGRRGGGDRGGRDRGGRDRGGRDSESDDDEGSRRRRGFGRRPE